jgi:tRNA pseudouridine38-40 synthase
VRIAIGIEYEGSAFAGWQRQTGLRSVEAEIEAAASFVAAQPVTLVAAGRTDAGVHALGQVAHFETDAERSARNWLLGINSRLPSDVALSWVRAVDPAFHARSSAVARGYRYVIDNRPTRSALERLRACWWREPLDAGRMNRAAQLLLGQHDFSSFRAAECQSRSPLRCVHALRVSRQESKVIIDITANAFLHHMVRNIAGTLLAIGSGERTESWLAAVLAARDRRGAGMTAPAQGLYLATVHYPPHFGIPVAAGVCSVMIPGAPDVPAGHRA